MKTVWNVVVVVLLVGAVIGVLVLKRANQSRQAPAPAGVPAAPAATIAAENTTAANPAEAGPKALPRLLELGGAECIPCKMMVPVLDALKKEYAGRLRVEFYDVQKDPRLGAPYGIRVIPTQIFLDASGKELFRHEGFFGKEDILAAWKASGVDLTGAAR